MFFFVGDQNADDDDDAEYVATADEDEDEAGFSCGAVFSCEDADDVGSGGMRGLGGKRGHIITGRNEETTTSTKTTTNNRTNKRIMSKRSQSSVVAI